MKRGGRPKTLATSSSCAASSSGAGGSWTEASAVAAERLADWQQNLSDQVSLLCHSTLFLLCHQNLQNRCYVHFVTRFAV